MDYCNASTSEQYSVEKWPARCRPEKDVDGFTPEMSGRMGSWIAPAYVAATLMGL